MGILFSRVFQALFGSKEVRILILGLDNAGKTTILYKLQNETDDEEIMTIPTIGFNVEAIEYKNLTLTVWDIGGQDKIRPLWRHYYSDTQGVIFVVDSNDRDRVAMAKDELHGLLDQFELRDATVLIYANKQDLPNALPPARLVQELELNSLRTHKWYIQACCGTSGDGLYEGLDWLSATLTKRKP
mmetsp:Transcript_12702/g.43316  ORF Transcript_12702/g.43316 Transcript_12702/m.43316 type:complete len:186 (+) Transcript_12702:169-726(+)